MAAQRHASGATLTDSSPAVTSSTPPKAGPRDAHEPDRSGNGHGSRASKNRIGILTRVAEADRGAINLPVWTSHLDHHLLDEDRLLLASDSFNTLLKGRLYCDLAPLLTGSHLRTDIVRSLRPRYDDLHVVKALDALARRGYLVSAEHGLDRASAAHWAELGASPCWVEKQLVRTRVALHGDKGAMTRAIESAGLVATGGTSVLNVVICRDYLDQAHAEWNIRAMADKVPWTVIQPGGAMALFGPIFCHGADAACWECLSYRLRGHQEVRNFLRNRGAVTAPAAGASIAADAVFALAASEIARWFVFGPDAPLHRHALSVEFGQLAIETHRVQRRSTCLACGDRESLRPDRSVPPIMLQSSPKPFRNSGGARSLTPEQTIAKFGHLVSPVSGIVTWVKRVTGVLDPWVHVHWSGSNLALNSRELSTLRLNLRSKCAGKGSSDAQSKASALCEAVERYSNCYHGIEPRREACARDLGDLALQPNDIQLFSERQFADREAINAVGRAMNMVPAPLDPERQIDWSPIWSLTESRQKYLPTSMLYSVGHGDRKAGDIIGDSNGCAAGNTLEEAIAQGFLELVERDAFAIWWYNRLQVPGVDLNGFGVEYLAQAEEAYARFGREIWALDATSDLGIPVIVALSRRKDEEREDIIYAAGAHFDPAIALMRAVCELNQFLNWVEGAREGGGGLELDDPLLKEWFRVARLGDLTYLRPRPGSRLRSKSDYEIEESGDTRDDLERCRALVESKGMEFLVVDQTREDIGMPVARVVVPGLRHFWARLAPGRLYSVPATMGRCDRQLSEAELNPHQVII